MRIVIMQGFLHSSIIPSRLGAGKKHYPTIYIRLRSSLTDLRRVSKWIFHRSFAVLYALTLMDLEAGAHPESWLFEPHQKYILQRLKGTTTGVAVNLAAMQRMHLRELQYTLAKRAVEITSLNQVQPSYKDELHDYGQSINYTIHPYSLTLMEPNSPSRARLRVYETMSQKESR